MTITSQNQDQAVDQELDVLVIGAGLSGVCAGAYLTMKSPDRRFAIVEGRASYGGTWDLFKYPGIRSDSDMYTFGYRFKPWGENSDIAPAQSILKYLRETIEEYRLAERMFFERRVTQLNWSSEQKRWDVTITDSQGKAQHIQTKFIIGCTGYYRYDSGYMPDFEGAKDFKGDIIHPQQWPEDYDYSGKKVVIIGSGATAVTMVPAMVEQAAHVTMLQRSPSYVFTRPAIDAFAQLLNKFLPQRVVNKIMRARNSLMFLAVYTLSKRWPDRMRKFFTNMAAKELGPDFDIDKHFNPKYNPWDERLCMVPDADLFKAFKSGQASIVTDHIDRFTETGILTKSGQMIEADLIVPATGLHFEFMDKLDVSVEGEPIDKSELVVYRGMMLDKMPNYAAVVGYTNAPWTLKADLTCDYVCRLLNHMKSHGYEVAQAIFDEPSMELEPPIDLKSGYVLRAHDRMPKQGKHAPWRNQDNYFKDKFTIKYSRFDDGVLRFQ